MLRKLFRFLLVLAIGATLGYVFHAPIDVKVKDWFGSQRVEKGKAIIEEGGENTVEWVEEKRAEKAETED